MDPKWSPAFTDLIRRSNSAAFGNWTLNSSIRAGAVGILDPAASNFTFVADIPDAEFDKDETSSIWSVESSSTHKKQTTVDFKGGYKDPSTGDKVETGLEVEWSFSKEASLASSGTAIGSVLVKEFGVLLEKKFDWLKAQAKPLGFATDAGITQGFGMVTQVRLCSGGVNVGASKANSSFSLTGSVDGIKAMTGGGGANASVKASFKETKEDESMDYHLWPALPDRVPSRDIAIIYQFATFDGKLIMPTWIGQLTGFMVHFNNRHGGTYIGRCSVTYKVPGKTTRQKKEVSVSGGYNRSISGIPLDATDLEVIVDFKHGDTFTFGWKTILGTWLNGEKTIDMGGVWPWGSHATVKS